jgi:hypothetical protein
MKYLHDIMIGLVAAGALIFYHSLYPVIRMHYHDERIVVCAPPESSPPSHWHKGEI